MATDKLPSADYFRQRLHHDPDTGVITFLSRPLEDFPNERIWRGWNSRQAGKPAFAQEASHGYRTGRFGGVNYYAHRIIWLLHYGQWPKVVDHLNGDPSDNRIINLRSCSHAENLTNAKRNRRNQSGATGVHFHEGAWVAKLGTQKLGRFSTKEEAMAARRNAASSAGLVTDRNTSL